MCNRGGSLYSLIGRRQGGADGTPPTCGFLPSVHFFSVFELRSILTGNKAEPQNHKQQSPDRVVLLSGLRVLLSGILKGSLNCYCAHQTGCCCDLSPSIIRGSVRGETERGEGVVSAHWSVIRGLCKLSRV